MTTDYVDQLIEELLPLPGWLSRNFFMMFELERRATDIGCRLEHERHRYLKALKSEQKHAIKSNESDSGYRHHHSSRKSKRISQSGFKNSSTLTRASSDKSSSTPASDTMLNEILRLQKLKSSLLKEKVEVGIFCSTLMKHSLSEIVNQKSSFAKKSKNDDFIISGSSSTVPLASGAMSRKSYSTHSNTNHVPPTRKLTESRIGSSCNKASSSHRQSEVGANQNRLSTNTGRGSNKAHSDNLIPSSEPPSTSLARRSLRITLGSQRLQTIDDTETSNQLGSNMEQTPNNEETELKKFSSFESSANRLSLSYNSTPQTDSKIDTEIGDTQPDADDGLCPLCGWGETDQLMVACDECNRWFHCSCVAYDVHMTETHEEDEWFCPQCIDRRT